MSAYVQSLIWAALMILIAVASKLGFLEHRAAEFLWMATIAAWVVVGTRRECLARNQSEA
jgi:hypothetical protein